MAEGIVLQNGGGGGASDELTATAANVLAGRTYVGADTEDEAGAGTMPDNGAMQRVLRAGENVPIPKGYHNGSGTVRAAPLAEQTPGNATAGDILRGKTAWSNGGRVDGSIPIIDTMGNGDGRGNNSQWFGLDGNNRTFWVELPHRAAYYTRHDGKPHVTIEAAALGNVIKEQVLQGARFSCQYGINVEGTIPTWHASGDIGGQKVIDAFQSTAFAGDYGAKGRGVFMRILGGVYTEPGTMWCFAPADTILPHNIREGVPILGTTGTMKDYAASCVPFDGAHFDGLHFSGWAEGLINTRARYSLGPIGGLNPARSAEATSQIGGNTTGGGEPAICLWVLTPSVALQPFRKALVTVSYSTNATIMPHGNGVNVWGGFSRITGQPRDRVLSPIREKAVTGQRAQSGRVTLDIPLDGVTEQGFLVIAAHGSNFRRTVGNTVFVARLERVELIA